ncbi:hypothetical protein CMV_029474 [Castanea mollissima]|uniref:Nodulin-related protein 1 n=1 Tax=Castanea mollissima TaxID=60419 RepID=A0A8J4Q6R4_9ROSI|nr:hypothetical protein CMV_029474 [Castanea mollissima]
MSGISPSHNLLYISTNRSVQIFIIFLSPTTVYKANPLPIHSDSLTYTYKGLLSDLQKKSNSSSETHQPEEKNSSSETHHPEEKKNQNQNQNQNQHQHHQPSNAELMASAKLLAEACQTTVSQGAGKVDKAMVAGAACDIFEAASSYGKLEETSYGKYVEKAETYLDQYGNPSSKSQSHSTTTTSTPSHSSNPSTTTGSKPHSTAGGGDHESEGNTESGTGDYVKMAQGFLKK